MSRYVIARLPLLSPEGEPITADAAAWRVEPALRFGMLRLRNGPLSHTVDLRSVLAAEVSEETEVNDIRKTLGRMALTGIGSSLFWVGAAGDSGPACSTSPPGALSKRGSTGERWCSATQA